MIRGTSPFSTADAPRSVLRSSHGSPQRRHSRSPSFHEKVSKNIKDTSQDSPVLSPLRCLSPEADLDISRKKSFGNLSSRPISYYSGRPPIRPLQLIPLSSSPPPICPLNRRRTQTETKSGKVKEDHRTINDEKKKKKKETISLVYSVLNSLVSSLPVFHSHYVDTNKHSKRRIGHRDMAVQVQGLSNVIKDDVCDVGTEEYSVYSDGEESANRVCAWLDSVRALRESHVRLLLRQLRQLKQIEKLEYAMKHIT